MKWRHHKFPQGGTVDHHEGMVGIIYTLDNTHTRNEHRCIQGLADTTRPLFRLMGAFALIFIPVFLSFQPSVPDEIQNGCPIVPFPG